MVRPIIAAIIVGLSSGCAHYAKEIRAATEKNQPLLIAYIQTSYPDYAGGVDLTISADNTSNKPLKYYIFEVEPFNAVGDRVTSRVGGKSRATVRVTGPIKPLREYRINFPPPYSWRAVWYNSSIVCAKIITATVVYSDGSELKYEDEELNQIISVEAKNDCSVSM